MVDNPSGLQKDISGAHQRDPYPVEDRGRLALAALCLTKSVKVQIKSPNKGKNDYFFKADY